MPTIKRVQRRSSGSTAAIILPSGRPHRAHLRSQGPDRHHDLDRAAQHGRRHRADLLPAMGVSRQSAQRRHRRNDDSVRAVLRRRHPGDPRRIGKSAVGRRHRLRPDRRCHGHHGRKHIPLAERAREREATEEAIRTLPPAGCMASGSRSSTRRRDVNRSIFFAAGIIIAGFIPLFTLSGVEGHIFGPMAQTYAYALAGGLIATFTVTPALSALILPEHVQETETFVVRGAASHLHADAEFLDPPQGGRPSAPRSCCSWWPGSPCGLLGLEFLPKLEEGNLWIRATLPSTISLEEGNTYVNRMRRIVSTFPEVESVVSQHGRPDDGTDAAGFFNAELFVPLKPTSEWRPRSRQGRPDQRGADQAAGRISGRGVQLLAIPPGQRRGSGFRREGREFDQAVRQRPSGDHPTRPPRSNPCWPRSAASPTLRSSPRSASRPCRSTSIASAPPATA